MSKPSSIKPNLLLQACTVFLLAFVPVACVEDPVEPHGEDCFNFDPIFGCLDDTLKGINIHFKNASAADTVHLFANVASETFPCCKVAPGAIRSVQINYGKRGTVNVTAGRNGAVLNTASCKLTQTEYDNGSKTITWNNTWAAC